MYLFFDTETTGVPRNYSAPMTDLKNWPRVIQLAWQVYDENRQNRNTGGRFLIKPHGWTVPKDNFWRVHGYSTEKCEAGGEPMVDVLTRFIDDLQICRFMIAHNMNFDYNVLGAEMLRYKLSSKNRATRICTMESGTDYCKLPGGRYGFKWPKLDELHFELFAEAFEGGHDALNDVNACSRCFFEMVDLEIISLNGST